MEAISSTIIRHVAFRHGWYYHYRVHTEKLASLEERFRSLSTFLLDAFTNTPHECFSSGPRCSALRLSLPVLLTHIQGHQMCSFARVAHETMSHSTAHSRVQMQLLHTDHASLAVEVPVWLHPHESSWYGCVCSSNSSLTGHIDVVSVDDHGVWIWDYKPAAAKEKYAHVQTYLYALMLSIRTGLPLSAFKCGYFDETDCYVFIPPDPEEVFSKMRQERSLVH